MAERPGAPRVPRYRPRRRRLLLMALAVATTVTVTMLMLDPPGGVPRRRAAPPPAAACTPGQSDGCVGGKIEVIVPGGHAGSATRP